MHTNKITFWIVAFLLLIFIESSFLGNGSFVYLLLGGSFAYFGFKKRSKWMTIVGLFFFLMTLMSLFSLRLLLIVAFFLLLHYLWKGSSSPTTIRPVTTLQEQPTNGIWKNALFSVQSSPFSSYEWEDIHIHGFFGDIHVDVTDTVLPKGTSFISVRQGIGRVKVEIPYEIPVRIHYTTLFGEVNIFDIGRKRLLNETLHYQEGYESKQNEGTELIISVATWIGDFEVTRK